MGPSVTPNKPATVRKETDKRTWVSKTQMVRYKRCPYAFWLVDSGQLKAADAVSSFTATLMAGGVAFQQLVEAAATPLEVAPENVPDLFERKDLMVYGVPMFRNHELRILGQPDGIVTDGGALYPVEMKSHAEVQPLDRLELAFYWLLLAPYRTSADAVPQGQLVLRREGKPITVTVPISETNLATVASLVEEVRRARIDGVEPRVCRCYVCTELRSDHVMASVQRQHDLTMIFGIGDDYRRALYALGCRRWDDLFALVPADVVAHFRERGLCVSNAIVERWQLHARAFQSRKALLADVRTALPSLDVYIALDLEYDPSAGIWLIGAALVEGGVATHTSWWAGTQRQERKAVVGLAEFLASNPKIPVVTWSGLSADVPRLAEAAKRFRVGDLIDDLTGRHLDLFQWAQFFLRLPVTSLGLKEVSDAFGFAKLSPIASGQQALMLYWKYKASRDRELRERLIAYNRDDLDALIFVVEAVRRLIDPVMQ
jgi:predicted RecB family nuclease